MLKHSCKKICVIGGAGGIGQPLSLLLKMNPLVSRINIFDIVGAKGVATDLSHIDTQSIIRGFEPSSSKFDDEDKNIGQALKNSDIVVIPAGIPRKPGMSRQDLFSANARLNLRFANAVSRYCPTALVAIISNPVNSTVPVFAEQMKKNKCYDSRKIFGVTTLDHVRANMFVANELKINVDWVHVPVIGGHAGASILPLLSQMKPEMIKQLSQNQIEDLTHRIQNAGTEIVDAKAGKGSATLSMAKAGAQFVNNLIKGLNGDKHIVEYAYVESNFENKCKWFAMPIQLGVNGIEKHLHIGHLNDFEKKKLDEAITELTPSIIAGIDFVSNNKQ